MAFLILAILNAFFAALNGVRLGVALVEDDSFNAVSALLIMILNIVAAMFCTTAYANLH